MLFSYTRGTAGFGAFAVASGAFRRATDGGKASGAAASIALKKWQLVVVVGDAATQTASFYVGDDAAAPTLAGAADRVASGATLARLGWPGQGPGQPGQPGVLKIACLKYFRKPFKIIA